MMLGRLSVMQMSDTCHNCSRSVGDQSPMHNWDAVCRYCGNLLWLGLGNVVACRMVRRTPNLIFVELGDGIQGFIHFSELTDERIGDTADFFTSDRIVRAAVVRVDMEMRQIWLSLKRAARA
jgi:hypothetical protein